MKYVLSYELSLRRCQREAKFKKGVCKKVNFLNAASVYWSVGYKMKRLRYFLLLFFNRAEVFICLVALTEMRFEADPVNCSHKNSESS